MGKVTNPAARWALYVLIGVPVLTVLVAASAADRMVATSGLPEPLGGAASGAQTLYLYGDRLRPLVEETDGAQTLNIYGPGGQIIAQATRDDQGNEGVRYLLTDHLGSTRVVVGADGNAVARYEYAPLGETTNAGTAAAEVQYRYTGHPYDEAQRLYQTPARGYDPATGRFVSVDPRRQDASPYVYAGNNPVGLVDPTGRGGVPFFLYTGYMKTGRPTDPNRSHIAHAISLKFGLNSKNMQRVLSADMFNTGGKGVWSYAETQSKSIMLGRGEGDRNYTFNGKMYWIVGGEEEVADMGRLEQGMAALGSRVKRFPSEVTILNFSGDEERGTNLRDKLRALNLDPLVVDAEQQGKWGESTKWKRWELQGFTSRGKSYTQNAFVKHVRSLEIAHKSKRLSMPEPTTSGEPNDIPVHDTQTTGQGEVAGDSSQGFYHEGEFIQFPTVPALQGDGASGSLPIPPNFVPIPQDLTDSGRGWVAQSSQWEFIIPSPSSSRSSSPE